LDVEHAFRIFVLYHKSNLKMQATGWQFPMLCRHTHSIQQRSAAFP